MNLDLLVQELTRDEGLRLKPYLDTVGKTTIGVGRNLTDVGISEAEADYLLQADIARTVADLDRLMPWWSGTPPWKPLDEVRQRVLLNMAFNMGVGPDCHPPGHLVEFRTFLTAVQEGRYGDAANAIGPAGAPLWNKQVGPRAVRLAEMMRTGTVAPEIT